jgi:DNA-binding XRE family transcriptional regulator
MAKLKRISRDRDLTPQEAEQDKTVRDQVMGEISPIRPPLIRRAMKLLRDERERQGLTQAEAAENAGLSREALCRLETQPGNATLKTLERYARGLGFDFEISLTPVKTKRKSHRHIA